MADEIYKKKATVNSIFKDSIVGIRTAQIW